MRGLRRRAVAALLLCLVLIMTGFAGSAQDSPSRELIWTWYRTDYPVLRGDANRTWMWGPGNDIDGPYWAIPKPFTSTLFEPYEESVDGMREVLYHEKSRMEINDPGAVRSNPWFVTNGLLALELITGRMQLGDNRFEQRHPSTAQIAGDADIYSPTYATLQTLLDIPATPVGETVTLRLLSGGSVVGDAATAGYGVTAAHNDPLRDHTVASVFWDFMNSSGTIYERGELVHGPLFQNPFFATGLPITEAYWVTVPVSGTEQDVLVQCFERRCLTYTPANPPGWQVEAGNIGLHYYHWRYGDAVIHSSETHYDQYP